jgi:putative membrane protein
MKNEIVFLILGCFFEISFAAAQGVDSVRVDTSQNTKGSTIISSGTVNTGTSTNTGVLPADTSVTMFVLQAASGSDKEIQLGKLAQAKAVHKSVKSFATKMITDHARASKELQKIANKKKITLPESPKDNKLKGEMLENKSGADFDQAYIKMMVSDHEATIGLFEKAATGLADPELKAFAAKMLPTIKHHYDMAKALSEKFNVDNTDND